MSYWIIIELQHIIKNTQNVLSINNIEIPSKYIFVYMFPNFFFLQIINTLQWCYKYVLDYTHPNVKTCGKWSKWSLMYIKACTSVHALYIGIKLQFRKRILDSNICNFLCIDNYFKVNNIRCDKVWKLLNTVGGAHTKVHEFYIYK